MHAKVAAFLSPRRLAAACEESARSHGGGGGALGTAQCPSTHVPVSHPPATSLSLLCHARAHSTCGRRGHQSVVRAPRAAIFGLGSKRRRDAPIEFTSQDDQTLEPDRPGRRTVGCECQTVAAHTYPEMEGVPGRKTSHESSMTLIHLRTTLHKTSRPNTF